MQYTILSIYEKWETNRPKNCIMKWYPSNTMDVFGNDIDLHLRLSLVLVTVIIILISLYITFLFHWLSLTCFSGFKVSKYAYRKVSRCPCALLSVKSPMCADGPPHSPGNCGTNAARRIAGFRHQSVPISKRAVMKGSLRWSPCCHPGFAANR